MATSTIKKLSNATTSSAGLMSSADKTKLGQLSTVKLDTTIRDVILKQGHASCPYKVDTTVTFPTAFPNQCWTVVLTCDQGGFSSTSTMSFKNVTKNGFTIFQSNDVSASMGVRWLAIGY